MELSVLTLTTRIAPGLPEFLESCRRQDITPELLGWGRKWTGWQMKFELLLDALPKVKSRVVMVVDSFDTIFVRPPRDILYKFDRFESPMVMSTQRGCWPDEEKLELYPPSPTPYRTLNAGGIIGSPRYIHRLLTTYWSATREDDDQRFWTNLFLSHPGIMKLDYHQNIFHTCGDLSLCFDAERGMFYNVMTKSWPAHLHANGAISKMSLGRAWAGLTFAEPKRDYFGEFDVKQVS